MFIFVNKEIIPTVHKTLPSIKCYLDRTHLLKIEMAEIDLSSIASPADIRKMSIEELRQLASEMREALIRKLSVHGGHVGPNLGMVEAVLALHYVFDTPEDKIVFDVSHQTYPHKMITGRMQAFTLPDPIRNGAS